jgi:hypothetical protein
MPAESLLFELHDSPTVVVQFWRSLVLIYLVCENQVLNLLRLSSKFPLPLVFHDFLEPLSPSVIPVTRSCLSHAINPSPW